MPTQVDLAMTDVTGSAAHESLVDLQPAARAMTTVLDGIVPADLARSTPCTDYRVGDLVDHVDQIARVTVAIARQDRAGIEAAGAVAPSATHLVADWQTAVPARVAAIGDAWSEPEVWGRGACVPGSDLPTATWGRIMLTELVVHAWDLATATGQAIVVPDATLQACWDHVAAFLPGAPLPDLWGPPVRLGDDAPVLARILAMTGRNP